LKFVNLKIHKYSNSQSMVTIACKYETEIKSFLNN